MNRKRDLSIYNIACLLPFLFILAMLMLHVVISDRTYSVEERRYLAQWPAFSIEEALDGSYGAEAESYFSDQFPFRDFWIRVSAFGNRRIA